MRIRINNLLKKKKMDSIQHHSETISVLKTIYPKDRLSLNDWYEYIHQITLENKFKEKK